ncbi:hypothetical protein ATCC90586_007339 [Pythium insidiosum]|nr:hypothetical protein ATCC90586_007339 [Pythium insidiosum]
MYVAVPLAPPSPAADAAPSRRTRPRDAPIKARRLLVALLLLVCVSSDLFLHQHVLLSHWRLLRHLVDSAAHGAVGACAWGLFLCFSRDKRATPVVSVWRSWRPFVLSCLATGILASALDIDHFVAAGALSLRGATHLQGRPFGHAVTFILAASVAVWGVSRHCGVSRSQSARRVCRVVIAWLSHQLRDGIRRGLWIWPLGSTPALFYPLYLAMELALPIALARWQRASFDDELDKNDDDDSEMGVERGENERC